MLLKLFLIVCLLCFTAFDRLKAEDSREESGNGSDDFDIDPDAFPGGTDDSDDGDSQASGDEDRRGEVPAVTVAVKHRDPPSAVDKDNEGGYNTEDNGGAGIVIDEDEDQQETKEKVQQEEPVPVEENSLLSHPGILAAIIIGGVLVLVCLIVFFVLIVCCVRKKDEGTYDLDEAMKEKLKYVAYTKAETSSDKEFFA